MTSAHALLPGRVYSRDAVLSLGIGRHRLSDSTLLRVLPGCYTRADAPAPLIEVARVLQQNLLPGAVISHLTAAQVIGLPLPHTVQGATGLLHCRASVGTPRRLNQQVVLHRMAPGPVMHYQRLTLSHPAEVLRELACDLDHDTLVACADALAGAAGATRCTFPWGRCATWPRR